MMALRRSWSATALFASLVLLTIGLAACSGPRGSAGPIELTIAPKGVCRFDPDGGPPRLKVANRLQQVDRGIGGTGSMAEARPAFMTSDRGIGGTGIVGVVTGFASICVDGIEVAYDASANVDLDGAAVDASQLRAGEVVAIQADVSQGAAKARQISVRLEVTGRVEIVERAKGEWRVAGQTVYVAPSVLGVGRFGPGDWVSVSGLRRPDGVIAASRLDKARVNALSVRGVVQEDWGVLRLGALELPRDSAKQGDWVHVIGVYVAGRPRVRSVTSDDLCPNPLRCFAGSVEHLLLQSYVRTDGERIWVDGVQVPARATVPLKAMSGARIVSLERQADGRYAVVAVRLADPIRLVGPRRPLPLPPEPPDPAAQPSPDATDQTAPDDSIDGKNSTAPVASADPEAKAPAAMTGPRLITGGSEMVSSVSPPIGPMRVAYRGDVTRGLPLGSVSMRPR